MYGNRTICAIGRGDSAVRVIHGRPARLAELREAVGVIRGLCQRRDASSTSGATLRLPWSEGSQLPIWIAGYGPKALQLAGEIADGFVLQLADPEITAWSIAAVRARRRGGRARPRRDHDLRRRAGLRRRDDLAHARDQCRWFGGMVGNHVAEIVSRYGADGAAVPPALTDYIAGREGYDYNEHGTRGEHAHGSSCPTRSSTASASSGRPPAQIERLHELATLGVDQFALYLQHDAKDATLAAYGEHVIPAVNEREAARI